MAKGQADESSDKQTVRESASSKKNVFSRRSLLQATGAAAAVGALSTLGSTAAAAQTVNLGDKGLSEGDQIDPYLQDYFVDGNEVHVPEGTYRWDGTNHTLGNAALIGDGNGVVFDMGDGFDAEPDFVATDGTVLMKNITQKGAIVGTSDHKNFGARAEAGAKLVLENVNRPDGMQGDGLSTGWYVHSSHAGEVVFRNCTVAGFGNNGIYGSGPGTSGGAGGRVVVEGGLYRNNNIASVRVGSSGSVVRKVTVLHDEPIPDVEGGGSNGRGIWVREGGDNITIEDCDVTFTADADGATNPIIIVPRDGAGSGAVTNCRIWNGDTSEEAIYQNGGSWDGSGEHLTGGGYDVTSGEEDWIEATGSDATEPTREKQWVGTSSTPSLSVSTGGASSVSGDSATLSGSVSDFGGADSVDVRFEYRESGASTWSRTDTQTLSSTGSFSDTVSGLSAGTDHEFRAVADASDGDSASGGSATFTTTVSYEHHLDVNTFSDSGIVYRFTANAKVAPGPDSQGETNDTVTDNGDGTYTVEGTTGAGYSDDWNFNGDVTEWYAEKRSDASSGDYQLVLDGSEVTPSELTGSQDPSVAVSTGTPSNVGTTAADLSGSLETLGEAAEADASMEYRRAGASSWNTAGTETLTTADTFTQTADGLDPSTEYEYRATADASDGDTDTGTVATFTTDAQTDTSTAPTVDRFEVREEGSPNPHADITVDWVVSDADADLSRVVVQVRDSSGMVVDAARTGVSGSSAADVDYFRIRKADGEQFTVDVYVTDATGAESTASATVTE